jgi:hypothetical protein
MRRASSKTKRSNPYFLPISQRPTFLQQRKRLYFNQHNETNVMHFSFNLLRIKGLYMFRALLAHPQDKLWHGYSETASVPQSTDIIHTQHTKCRLCSASCG